MKSLPNVAASDGRFGVKALAVCALSLASSIPPVTWAHGGLTIDEDKCKLRVGRFTMHFTGYQPQNTMAKEFCEDIPATGQTIVVLDYVDPELRDMPTEVRIIKDTGNESDLESVTIFHLQPQVYPTGSLNLEYNFENPGKYVGLVTVGAADKKIVSRFPFSVGTRSYLKEIGIALGVILAGIALYLFSFRAVGRKKKPAA